MAIWSNVSEDHPGYCGPANGHSARFITIWSCTTLALTYLAFLVFFVVSVLTRTPHGTPPKKKREKKENGRSGVMRGRRNHWHRGIGGQQVH